MNFEVASIGFFNNELEGFYEKSVDLHNLSFFYRSVINFIFYPGLYDMAFHLPFRPQAGSTSSVFLILGIRVFVDYAGMVCFRSRAQKIQKKHHVYAGFKPSVPA